MSRKRKKRRTTAAPKSQAAPIPSDAALAEEYKRVCALAERGAHDDALRRYDTLYKAVNETRLKALIDNDRAVLAALGADHAAARRGLEGALALDDHCAVARANLALLASDAAADCPSTAGAARVAAPLARPAPLPRVRVAVLGFLFNWPSTGGGIVHTAELCRFLAGAGYEVAHFFARYAPWEIGKVEGALPFNSQALVFEHAGWNSATIQARFREAVDAFGPDHASSPIRGT